MMFSKLGGIVLSEIAGYCGRCRRGGGGVLLHITGCEELKMGRERAIKN